MELTTRQIPFLKEVPGMKIFSLNDIFGADNHYSSNIELKSSWAIKLSAPQNKDNMEDIIAKMSFPKKGFFGRRVELLAGADNLSTVEEAEGAVIKASISIYSYRDTVYLGRLFSTKGGEGNGRFIAEYGMQRAIKRGAKKLYLRVDPNEGLLVDKYSERGFREIAGAREINNIKKISLFIKDIPEPRIYMVYDVLKQRLLPFLKYNGEIPLE